MNKRVFLSGAVLCLLGLLATSAVGYELTERFRLGAVVESLAYVNSGPLAGKVAFIDGWTVYVSDPQMGGYEKLFSVLGIPFVAAPRGLAYLSQGDFAGNFLFSDRYNPNTLFLVTTAGGLVGAVHAQNFSCFGAEGVTQITSGPYQGQVAMLVYNEPYASTHIVIFGLQQIGSEIHAYLAKDILNVSQGSPYGLAFLPADFPDPDFANTFVCAESITASLIVVNDQGVQIGAFPGIHFSEGLAYIPDGAYAGKLFLADMCLLEAQVRNLDGSFKIPAPIPLIGMGLVGIHSYTWLSGRQQLYLIGWDGFDWNLPVYLASRLSAGVWRKDDEFRSTHFRMTRNITDRAADGTYRLFGIVSARGTPARYAVDQLDAQGARLNTTPLPAQYTGRSFGNLVYVPGPTTAEDRFIAPFQKAIYSFDASFAYPATIIDLSAKVTKNVSQICYDPAAKRYYLIDGTLLRVFDATWNLLYTFDLSGLCPGPFGSVEKFTSGDLQGQIAVLNVADNELIILNFEYQIAPDILSPANNSVLTSAHLTRVDWTDSTGTAPFTYQYEAFSDSGYTALVYSSGWLSASEIPTPGTPLGVYYVRARAQDGVGHTSDWSNGSSNPYKITVAINDGLTDLSPANMRIGLKNSDDVGTKFDLKAEVLKSGVVVGSGELDGVNGGSSGFNKAVKRTIALALSGSPTILPGDTLSFRLSVRISTTVSGHRSGTARLWFNDTQANSSFDATIGGVNNNYYLLGGSLLGGSAGPGPKKTIDVFVDKLKGGNPFKPFGTWSKTF